MYYLIFGGAKVCFKLEKFSIEKGHGTHLYKMKINRKPKCIAINATKSHFRATFSFSFRIEYSWWWFAVLCDLNDAVECELRVRTICTKSAILIFKKKSSRSKCTCVYLNQMMMTMTLCKMCDTHCVSIYFSSVLGFRFSIHMISMKMKAISTFLFWAIEVLVFHAWMTDARECICFYYMF